MDLSSCLALLQTSHCNSIIWNLKLTVEANNVLLIGRDVAAKSLPGANTEEFGARVVGPDCQSDKQCSGFLVPFFFFFFPQLKLVSVLLEGNQKIGSQM